MASDKAMESENITFEANTGNPIEADFEDSCKGAYFYSTQDVHVAFDEPANSGSFFIPKTTVVSIEKGAFTRISAIGDSTTGTLYILASRVSGV